MRYLSVRNTPNSMTDLVHKIIIPIIFCPMIILLLRKLLQHVIIPMF